MEKTAEQVGTTQYGLEIRKATRKTDVWPGYHETMPLGKAGYWIGTHASHEYVGRTKADLDWSLEHIYTA